MMNDCGACNWTSEYHDKGCAKLAAIQAELEGLGQGGSLAEHGLGGGLGQAQGCVEDLTDRARDAQERYGAMATTPRADRTFTRAEVLTVLLAYKALQAMTTQRTAAGCGELIAIFERME